MKSRVDEVLAAEAVSLPDFKQFIKWDPTDTSEDYVMNACLSAATEEAELFTRRVIVQASWKTYLESFCNVTLDVHPVDVDTIVVKYYDVDNVFQTLNPIEYSVIHGGADGYVEILFDGDMPELYDRYESVVISYTAGYTELPYKIELGILKRAATDFESRTNEVVGTTVNKTMYDSYVDWYPFKMMG